MGECIQIINMMISLHDKSPNGHNVFISYCVVMMGPQLLLPLLLLLLLVRRSM